MTSRHRRPKTRTPPVLSQLLERSSTPAHGWAYELRDALRAAKQDPSVKNQLRVAECAAILRQWNVCQKASDRGLKACSKQASEQQKELKDLLKTAKDELSVVSAVDSPVFTQQLLPRLWNHTGNLAHELLCFTAQGSFTNLTWIHNIALQGDVRALERLVALGAALDVPITSETPHMRTPHVSAPMGSTALLLIMAHLAVYKRMKDKSPQLAQAAISPAIQKSLDGGIQCAIILVMLGADCQTRLVYDPDDVNPFAFPQSPLVGYEAMELLGKSVKDMALSLQDAELLEAIRLMEEAPIDHAWCRCGSRLRWKDCHASPHVDGQHPHCVKEDDHIYYRYSPLAPCPCRHSKKTNFDCCGWLAFRPFYLVDHSGMLHEQFVMAADSVVGQLSAELSARGMQPLLGSGSPSEQKAKHVAAVREMGQRGMEVTAALTHPKCPTGSWDVNVYAGVLERLDGL